jgi:WS/DGAT/MGAT family acyltransferase
MGSNHTTVPPASEPLSPFDNLFLVSERQDTHMHVAVTAIFEPGTLMNGSGGVDIERIRNYIAARLHWIPRYRQRLKYTPLLGSPVWVDDERFNINYHVRHASLPQPGDEQQLQCLAARIKSQQLDRDKPLWEMYIVEGLKGGRFAMITKTHHCMIDGISGADLLAVLLQPFPQDTPPAPEPFKPRPAPTWRGLLQSDIARRVGAPLNGARHLIADPTATRDEIRTAAAAVAGIVPSVRRASATPFNRAIGPYRRFDWLAMDLDAVKAVKNALGGTVNDVVLATVAGAVRRFLQRRRVNVDALDFRALVPVSIRRDEERGAMGNRVAAWLADLPVAERHPRTRFASLCKTTAGLKESRQAAGSEVLTGVTGWTGSSILSAALRLAFRARPFNLVVTNVPGPQVPLYLLDAPMRAVYPQVPLFPNQGLGVALFSYAGTLHWGFNADWELMPDLRDFVTAIQDSFSELQGEAGVSRLRPAASRPAARRRGRQVHRRTINGNRTAGRLAVTMAASQAADG